MLEKSKCSLRVVSLFLCNSSTLAKNHKQLYDFRTWKEKAIKKPLKLNKKGIVPIVSSSVFPSHLHSLIKVSCLFCQKQLWKFNIVNSHFTLAFLLGLLTSVSALYVQPINHVKFQKLYWCNRRNATKKNNTSILLNLYSSFLAPKSCR